MLFPSIEASLDFDCMYPVMWVTNSQVWGEDIDGIIDLYDAPTGEKPRIAGRALCLMQYIVLPVKEEKDPATREG